MTKENVTPETPGKVYTDFEEFLRETIGVSPANPEDAPRVIGVLPPKNPAFVPREDSASPLKYSVTSAKERKVSAFRASRQAASLIKNLRRANPSLERDVLLEKAVTEFVALEQEANRARYALRKVQKRTSMVVSADERTAMRYLRANPDLFNKLLVAARKEAPANQ